MRYICLLDSEKYRKGKVKKRPLKEWKEFNHIKYRAVKRNGLMYLLYNELTAWQKLASLTFQVGEISHNS